MLNRRIVLYITNQRTHLCKNAIHAIDSIKNILPKDATITVKSINPNKSRKRYLPSISFKIGNKTIYRISGGITTHTLLKALKNLG